MKKDEEEETDNEQEDDDEESQEENMINSKEEIHKLIKDYYYNKTNNELKELLRIYNKPTKGNKIHLVDRVLEIEEYNNIDLINN